MNTNYSITGAQSVFPRRSASKGSKVSTRLFGFVLSLALAFAATGIPLESFAQCIGAGCTGSGSPLGTGMQSGNGNNLIGGNNLLNTPGNWNNINFTSPNANNLLGGLTGGQITGGGMSTIRGIFRSVLRFLPNNRIRVGPINITDDAGAAMTGIESQACRILQLLGIEGDGNSGAFGALAMTVSGLIAVLSAALGSYRVALGTLVVGIGSMIMESMVELFFGDIECDFLFNFTV